MNGFGALTLALAAAALVCPIAASAQDAQHQLSTTSHISLTIAPSAIVRSNERSAAGFTVVGNDGASLDKSGVTYSMRDSRGERTFQTLQGLQAAMAGAKRVGERQLDVTLVF